MPSLLNVSNDASRKPKQLNLIDVEVLVGSKEQNLFKKAKVGKC